MVEREKFVDEVLKHTVSLKRLIQRNRHAGHSNSMMKLRMNFMIARLEQSAASQQELSTDQTKYSLISTTPIKVMSENKVFEVLRMADYEEPTPQWSQT